MVIGHDVLTDGRKILVVWHDVLTDGWNIMMESRMY